MSVGIGKRRHKRIRTALPVRLWGMDANGRPFIEVSTTVNVSRTGTQLSCIPTKLSEGDIIGLRCGERKHNFRVIWTGKKGTAEEGHVGLQSLEPGKWIWDGLRLPADDIDIYAQPPHLEQRMVKRLQSLVSAEIVSSEGTKQRVLAFVTNIGTGGCYVRMHYPTPVETKVCIALWLDEQHKIWIDGIVVSSHPEIGAGIKFLNVTRRATEAIEQYIELISEPDAARVEQ